MHKISVKQIVTSKWLVKTAMLALLGGLALPGPAAATGWDVGYWLVAPAKTLATGQAQCWDAYGNARDCANTGEDGQYQKGVKPVLGKRFKDLQNGTVVDLLTGLIWLKNANCIGSNYPSFDYDKDQEDGMVFWQHALDFVAGINAGTYDCGDTSKAGVHQTDWRLPNFKELQSLINIGYVNPALSNAAGTGQWTEGDAFSGVKSTHYWSSSSLAENPLGAWIVNLGGGAAPTLGYKPGDVYAVWPVRGGQ